MISHITLYSSLALSLFSVAALATPHTTPTITMTSSYAPTTASGTAKETATAVYDTFDDFTADMPACINACWADIWYYTNTVCSTVKCACLIPEPDLTDPQLAAEFDQINTCSTQCPNLDPVALQAAADMWTDTCAPYLAQYGPIPPAKYDYYVNALAAASGNTTKSAPPPYPTSTPVSVYHNTTASMTTRNATVVATSTGVLQATANAGVANVAGWELPLLVSFLVGVAGWV